MQAKLAALTAAEPQGSSSNERFEPKVGKENSSKKPEKLDKTAAKSKAQPAVPKSGPEGPETEAARQARLRRVCERKPSGRLNVPESIHLRWKNGSRQDREDLLDTLESCQWDKDWPVCFWIRIYISLLQAYDSRYNTWSKVFGVSSLVSGNPRGCFCFYHRAFCRQDQQVEQKETSCLAHRGNHEQQALVV